MNNIVYVGSNSGDAKRSLRVFTVDDESGTLAEKFCVEDSQDAIYLARNKDFLYVAEKCDDEVNPGAVSVYGIVGDSLNRLATYSVAMTVPCHISLAPSGDKLVWAEYRNGTAGIMNIRADGLLEDTIAHVKHVGHGPNEVRQEAAHCHCAIVTPDSKYLCICDLGIDRVVVYSMNSVGEMIEESCKGFVCTPGAGPRHLIFGPCGKYAYLITELANTVIKLRYEDGRFEREQEFSTLPTDFADFSKCAAIKISPDGEYLLATNRGHDSIAVFKIDADSGDLELVRINPLNGKFPRDIEFLNNGDYLVVGHKMSDELAVYSFDKANGEMKQVGMGYSMIKPLAFNVVR